jgi:hypothetical protein
MRPARILLPLLLAFATLGALADAQTRPAPRQNDDGDVVEVPRPPADSPEVIRPGPGVDALISPDSQGLYSPRESSRETVCFTMRSYLVARESRNSDSTHLVGYSTCHPAAGLELRSTDRVTR